MIFSNYMIEYLSKSKPPMIDSTVLSKLLTKTCIFSLYCIIWISTLWNALYKLHAAMQMPEYLR